MKTLIRETLNRYYNAPPEKLIEELNNLVPTRSVIEILDNYQGDLNNDIELVNHFTQDTPYFTSDKEQMEYIKKIKDLILCFRGI